MIARVMNWLGQRQATIHRVEETTRRAAIRMEWIESVVITDQLCSAGGSGGECPSVNLIYDRLTRAGCPGALLGGGDCGEEGGAHG